LINKIQALLSLYFWLDLKVFQLNTTHDIFSTPFLALCFGKAEAEPVTIVSYFLFFL